MTVIPKAPCYIKVATNLDTHAWRTGRLTVGVSDDDKPDGPVDLLVVRGAPAGS
jgi:serine/threonine protein phosphatase 1